MRCPAYDNGAHRMQDSEYSAVRCGFVSTCRCGRTLTFPTDEMLVAWGVDAPAAGDAALLP